jgi:YbbR domain-containing protein
MLFSTEKFFQKEERQFFIRRLLRRMFLEDWLIKAIALVITLALWLGATGLRTSITTRVNNVALKLRVSNDIEVTNSPVQEVDLVITGDKRKIDQLNPRDLVVSLDLVDVQAGYRTIQMTPENVNVELPTGVKLEEIQPSKIAVKLETVAEREVAVKAETEASVADGFEIYNQTILPQKVRVRGPESFIKSLDFVSTEKINLENQKQDFTARQVPINIVNPKATVLDTVVDVAFKIGEKRIERVFIVPVRTATGSNTATVVLYGRRTILDSVKSENLEVKVLKNDTGEDSPHLILPAEIQEKVEIKRLKIN